ncbi:hypothetical protein C0J52_22346, partial [Blattella germanica]
HVDRETVGRQPDKKVLDLVSSHPLTTHSLQSVDRHSESHLVHGGVAPYYAKIDTANHALATLSSWKRKSDRYEYSD